MYTIYDRFARKVVRDDWHRAVHAAKEMVKRTPTENGHVAPVSIWRIGMVVAVVTDDANAVTVHILNDFERQYEATGYACTAFPG